jgi:hypothetical protein
MSVWTDPGASGTGGVAGSGGSGGHTATGGQGGSGGVTSAISTGGSAGGTTGTLAVRGGVRDVATAQCISTSSGGGCPFTAADLQCVQGPCGSNLRACYQGPSGICADYATCMLACPCDTGRSTCENGCLQTKAMSNPDCASCALDLVSCYSKNGCVLPTCAGGATTGG